MRYFAIGAVLGSFLVAAARLAFRGDAFATALLIGFGSPLLMLGAAALSSAKAVPRKADPAKIARMERELGLAEAPTVRTEGPQEGTTAWEGDRLLVYRAGHWAQAQANVVDTEAPTTVATFHGAPTFGHKIEGP